MTERRKEAGSYKYMSGIEAAVDIIGGKWKTLILYSLSEETLRYGQIQSRLRHKITQRMLTRDLRELEAAGLITRTVYPVFPPKVEYAITEKGRSLMPILDSLCLWACEHMAEDIEHLCD